MEEKKIDELNRDLIIDRFNESINEILEYSKNKVSEKDFKIYILPMFDGSVEINDDNYRIFLHNLRTLAMSYTNELDVVDDETGEVLFTLPPILYNIDDLNDLISRINYNQIVNKYKSSNPIEANNYMGNIANDLGELFSNPKKEKYVEEIEKMMIRYGIGKYKDNDDSVNVGNSSNEDVSDIFDYDD